MASKEDIRRLMHKQKKPSRVNHPMAKYNAMGQLLCVICGCSIKSELVWSVHLKSKRHKESVTGLKQESCIKTKNQSLQSARLVVGYERQTHSAGSQMRSQSTEGPDRSKQSKDLLISPYEQDRISLTKKETRTDKPSHGLLSADLLDNKTNEDVTSPVKCAIEDGNTDFSERSTQIRGPSISEALPEGFFDDPKLDAKVRKVDYVDPQESEWEKFKKILTQESKVSDDIVEVEEQESEMVKSLVELNTLKGCLTRVDDLKVRQEFLKRKKGVREGSTKTEDSNSSHSDGEFEDVLNWRAKKAL